MLWLSIILRNFAGILEVTVIPIIKFELPPNYEAIRRAFDLIGQRPIFAFSPYIYNPHCVEIGPELIAHEQVHITRQGALPATWWESYIADENFRLAEEILARVAEYLVLTNASTRQQRRQVFNTMAKRLRAPLYGYKPTLSEERSKKLLKMALREGVKLTASSFEGEPINANAWTP